MTGTCTGCGDYQSGDPSGKCWECRIAEPGYRARLDATVRKGIAAEYAAHPGVAPDPARVRRSRPLPVLLRRSDPQRVPRVRMGNGCRLYHPDDPGAETREPAKCTECSARDIEAGLRAEAEARNTYEVPDPPEPQPHITGPASPGPEVTEPAQPEMELSA